MIETMAMYVQTGLLAGIFITGIVACVKLSRLPDRISVAIKSKVIIRAPDKIVDPVAIKRRREQMLEQSRGN